MSGENGKKQTRIKRLRQKIAKESMAEAALTEGEPGGVRGTKEAAPTVKRRKKAKKPEETREPGGARGSGEPILVAKNLAEGGRNKRASASGNFVDVLV